jgi:hypothetical protein
MTLGIIIKNDTRHNDAQHNCKNKTLNITTHSIIIKKHTRRDDTQHNYKNKTLNIMTFSIIIKNDTQHYVMNAASVNDPFPFRSAAWLSWSNSGPTILSSRV